MGVILKAAQAVVNGVWGLGRLGADVSSVSRTPSHHGASQRRRLANWHPLYADINTLLSSDAPVLRERVRDMVRNNGWAAALANDFEVNVVGTGIRPYWAEVEKGVKKRLKRKWNAWEEEADAEGHSDFYGLQALVARAYFTDGECFVRMRHRRPSDGLAVPLQLQVLEADHCPFYFNQDRRNGHKIRAGIEYDRLGRTVAYHFLRQHPGDHQATFDGRSFGDDTVRVPASEVMHVFKPLRPGQRRGQPAMTPILLRLRDLDIGESAEVVRRQIASAITGFIELPDEGIQRESSTPAVSETGRVEEDVANIGISLGELINLPEGGKVSFPEIPTAGDYDRWMPSQLRGLSAGVGALYEHVAGDLTGVNYSSARVGLIQLVRRIETEVYKRMVFQFCRPVLATWLNEVRVGGLRLPGWNEDPLVYTQPEWVPHAQEWVDPQKHVSAFETGCKAGFTSRDLVILGQGYDPDEIDEMNERSRKRAKAHGLEYTSDPMKVRPGSGAEGSGSEPQDPDEAEARRERREERGR